MKLIKKLKGFKIMELAEKEQEERGYPFAVTMGEYDDVEFECESIQECEENILSY